jgi:hypothetical protein
MSVCLWVAAGFFAGTICMGAVCARLIKRTLLDIERGIRDMDDDNA